MNILQTETVNENQLQVNQKEILKEIRNHLAGRVVGITRDEILLEEVLKCTITKIALEKTEKQLPTNESLAVKYHQIFRNLIKDFPNVFKNSEILLGVKEILFIHDKLNLIDLKNMPRDFFGDAYETFIGNNYRGQEGQFFTPLNAVDLLIQITKPQSKDKILDPACGAGGFLASALSYILENEKKINNNVFGIDKDQFLAEITKVRLTIHYSSTFNIICGDSLNGEDIFNKLNGNNKFSLILTNPPFGSKIVSLAEENKEKFELAYKWRHNKNNNKYEKTVKLSRNVPPQILFLERCINLLEKNGRLGIVLPESVISSPKYKYVVDYLINKTTPVAIVGMPESLFKTSGKGGTHTKTDLVVLINKLPNEEDEIFMAEAKWCGHDSRGKNIPHDELPKIGELFDKIRIIKKSNLGFYIKCKDIKDNILAPKYYISDYEDAFKSLKNEYDLIKISELIKKGYISLSTGDEVGKLAYGTGIIPFIRTSDISNWEIKSDPKQLVSEEIYQKYKNKQDIKEEDIFMVRDGTYLIGTCAMVTKSDIPLLYQSHIYRIRVSENANFDSYTFLALLSSPIVRSQIKSQSFTQDIIDSLGKRIEEIVVPIPKSNERKAIISKQVKQVIESKIKSKESLINLNRLLPNFISNQLIQNK